MPAWEECPTCGGDGKVGNNEDCPTCGGSGRLPERVTCPTCLGALYVDSDPCPTCFMQGTMPIHGLHSEMLKVVIGVLNEVGGAAGVVSAREVFEATDLGEYNSLDAAQKDQYHVVVSMGQTDLNDGSNARTVLMNLFGSGSTTRANLLALIT